MKKGFTLIELLAVIIILAVIALIATPVVLNVVDAAKKSAAKESVYGYAEAVKLARYEYMFAHEGAEPTMSDLGTITHGGAAVTCQSTTITNGMVELRNCEVSNYKTVKFDYDGKNVTEASASTSSSSSSSSSAAA